MNKKIIALIISAAVVIGGAGAAVAILRRPSPEVEEATTGVTEAYTEDIYVTSETIPEEYSVNENGEVIVTDEQGETSVFVTIATTARDVVNTVSNVATTTRNAVTGNRATTVRSTTRSTTTRAANNNTTNRTTTKASTTTKKTTQPQSVSGFVADAIGDDADRSFLGYRYSSDGYYYCDDKDNWQKGTGYNEVYDKWAPVAAMYIDQVRIRFRYDNKNWMIQLWKGQYGYLLIGAEIGVYTCELDEYSGGTGDINHFDVADKSDWLYMQLDCYYCEGGKGQYKKIFTRPYDKYWWATGFVKGQLTKYTAPRTELKCKDRITFKSADQASIFVQGLKQCGFKRAGGSDSLVDDSYYANGADVWLLWSTLYNDSFVGYGT